MSRQLFLNHIGSRQEVIFKNAALNIFLKFSKKHNEVNYICSKVEFCYMITLLKRELLTRIMADKRKI